MEFLERLFAELHNDTTAGGYVYIRGTVSNENVIENRRFQFLFFKWGKLERLPLTSTTNCCGKIVCT